MTLSNQCLFESDSPELAQIINTANVGVWEIDIRTKKVTWSEGFYKVLGYQPGEIACTYQNFIEHIVYHQDKKTILNQIGNPGLPGHAESELRLLTKDGYQWFQCSATQPSEGKVAGTLINIHQQKVLASKAVARQQTHELIKVAGWQIDNVFKLLALSDETFDMLELEEHTVISIEEFVSFFEPDQRPILNRALVACMKYGRPFDLDLKLRTVRNNLLWVKIKAVAEIDDAGKCVMLKGVIQDIDESKKHERALRSSIKVLDHRNKRLQNFASIVSHNLRSYVGNLQTMITMFDEAENDREREETFSRIKTIGDSLTTTVDHLNEMVKVEHDVDQPRTEVNFKTVFEQIFNSLQSTIRATQAVITADFSKCPSVAYLPAYLDSIFHNLVSNALKYRHPLRAPQISCTTYKECGHCYLVVEDNGVGIDLAKHGEKLFGIYQTFHQNSDAHGIGLFITRNQIEALGGDISVESTPGVGTKFTIKLN